jgi:lysophospholipase L1-like esterase
MSRWLIAAAFVAATNLAAQTPSPTDWPNLQRFAAANAALRPPAKGEDRVIFMGNSITEGWAPLFGTMFPGKPYIGRGISGQTTPQMLIRFRQDVVTLEPSVVVILAGTNDIAGNTGPSTLGMIEDNIASMTEIALANGIDVLLCSVLPVYDYPWKKGLEPAGKIVALNDWLRDYAFRPHASARNATVGYVDFHSAMKDSQNGLRAELTRDGVHPNEAGYRVMSPIIEQAIERQLTRRHGVH